MSQAAEHAAADAWTALDEREKALAAREAAVAERLAPATTATASKFEARLVPAPQPQPALAPRETALLVEATAAEAGARMHHSPSPSAGASGRNQSDRRHPETHDGSGVAAPRPAPAGGSPATLSGCDMLSAMSCRPGPRGVQSLSRYSTEAVPLLHRVQRAHQHQWSTKTKKREARSALCT